MIIAEIFDLDAFPEMAGSVLKKRLLLKTLKKNTS